MRSFLIWLTLGALMFLCSCQESTYAPQVYQPNQQTTKLQQQLKPVQPTISYTNELDLFYNNDFKLTFEEDLQKFYTKVDQLAVHKASKDKMLSANTLYRALNVVYAPDSIKDISKTTHFASRTKPLY